MTNTAKALIIVVLALLTAVAVADTLKCNFCKKPLVGTYRIFEGKNLHDACFQDHYALRCEHCRKPILAKYTVYQNRNLHDSCYNVAYAKYCGICDGAIEGQYYDNLWGDVVHASHIGEYPPCEYCGRLKAGRLTGKGLRYPDGREICGVCLESAVTRIADARGLLVKARETLRKYGIQIEHDFRLKLINKNEMARLGPSGRSDLSGFAELKERSALLGLVKERKIKIYALSGLPEDVMLGVLAHELMHVWMFTQCPWETDEVLAEGSCEYAAYLALKDHRSDLARYCLENMDQRDDPVYGIGYRKVSGFVQSVGVAGWLDYLKEHADPPWR